MSHQVNKEDTHTGTDTRTHTHTHTHTTYSLTDTPIHMKLSFVSHGGDVPYGRRQR